MSRSYKANRHFHSTATATDKRTFVIFRQGMFTSLTKIEDALAELLRQQSLPGMTICIDLTCHCGKCLVHFARYAAGQARARKQAPLCSSTITSVSALQEQIDHIAESDHTTIAYAVRLERERKEDYARRYPLIPSHITTSDTYAWFGNGRP